MTRKVSLLALVLAAAGLLAPPRAGADAGVPGLRVLAQDSRGVTVEYRLPSFSQALETTEGGEFTRLEVSGLGALSAPGRPELPAGGAWVALPAVGGYTVRVLEQETETIEGVDVVPVFRPDFVPDSDLGQRPVRVFEYDRATYESAGVYPASVAAIEGEAWLRFQRVGLLRFYPVRAEPQARRVTVARRLVVRVEFDAAAGGLGALESAGLRPAPGRERGFEGIYRGAILNYEQGRAWRARRAASRFSVERAPGTGPAGAVQGTGNPEWKARVDTTGAWRVDFTQLANLGFPSGIATSALAAFVRDTTAGLAPVPWTATEIAIDVEDADTDGFFGPGDFLILPVRNWAERSLPTLAERRHGNAQVIWISYWTGTTGRRVRPEAGWLNALAPAVPTSFPSYRRYERNFFYLQYPDRNRFPNQDQVYWTSGFSDLTPIDTLRADLLDLDPAGADLRIRAEWTGNENVLHTVNAWWGSSGGETVLWTGRTFNGKNAFVDSTTIPPSAASQGVNRFRISGSGHPSGSGAPFNWFEVTYPRLYRARNNRLDCNTAGLADTVELAIENFSGATAPEVFAYDVSNWSDVARLSVAPAQVEDLGGGAWRVRLQVLAPGGALRSYSVATSLRTLPSSALTAETPSSLYLTTPGAADFVIVAHDPLAAECQALVNHRQSRGIPTLLVRAQDVYDEFNGGRKSHFAIRRFLRYALENWDTRFFLLVGDGSEDARGELGSSAPEFLPTPVIQGPIPVSAGFEAVPSDNWYVFQLGPAGGSFDDLLPDAVIGRWSAASAAEVQGLVQKMLAYETTGLDEPWRSRAILSADDNFSDQTTFGGGGGSIEYCLRNSEAVFRSINLRCRDLIQLDAGFRDFDTRPHLLTDTLAHLPRFPGQACTTVRDKNSTIIYVRDFTAPRLFTLLSQGTAFYNFQGHGNATVMTHEEIYRSLQSFQDLDVISNTGKPWYFSGFACHLNAFANVNEGRGFGDALAERMVLAPGKGAIASFASTAFELLPSPNISNHYNVHLYRAFFEDPPYDEFAGQSGARVLLGEATALGTTRMVANNFGLEQRASQTYCFLGDPTTAMSFGAPRLYADAPDAGALRSGVPYYPTNSADTVAVEVEVVDESYLADLTLTLEGEVPGGAVPDTDFVVTPTFPDTGSGKRYLILYQATPPPASHDVVFTARDRFGLTGEFRLRFELDAALTLNGQWTRDGEAGVSGAEYQWRVRSPARLFASDFGLLVNGTPEMFSASPAPGDTTGRLWDLRFAPVLDRPTNTLQMDVALARGGVSRTLQLQQVGDLARLDNVYPFPSPFDEFTTFNFDLTTGSFTDVLLRVFSVAGRLVYERVARAEPPGYKQWVWDGRDASGHKVGNGVYIFRVAVVNQAGEQTFVEGRVAKAPPKKAVVSPTP